MNKTEQIKIKNTAILISKPDKCPYCNNYITPDVIKSFDATSHQQPVIFSMMQCPHCEEFFMVKYPFNPMIEICNTPLYWCQIFGGNGIIKEFSNEIVEVSPNFVNIYNDAYKAHQSGLKEIVGLGLRRAFEFLIKDYAIYFNQEKREEIKIKPLNQVINTFFPNGEIKDIINRTSWVGNDFTHYDSKHPDMNIDDLFNLIDLVVSKINEDIKIKSYIEIIEKK